MGPVEGSNASHSIIAVVSCELGGDSETTRGDESSCRQGESWGADHGATPFGGDYSSDRWHQLSRASFQVATVVVVLLDRVRLEGQGPSDGVEFLPKPKKQQQCTREM